MFFFDYHTVLTAALALLLFLAVLRLYQLRKAKSSNVAKTIRTTKSLESINPAKHESGSSESPSSVSELLEHEELTPLLTNLAKTVEAEFGFAWSEFTLESEGAKSERDEKKASVSSHLIRVDKDLAVRFRWQEGDGDLKLETRMESVENLTRAYVQNIQKIQHYKRLANRDTLTGLFNAAYLRLRLKEEIERAKRFNRSVGVLILDVDHFKQINDNKGHLSGDQALKYLATLVSESVRAVDIVCRYGGDELCIILPDSSETTIRGTMNRLRKLIKGGSSAATGIDLTVSIGGAISDFGALSPEELFELADRAMLSAKRRGRNQCFFATTSPDTAPTPTTTSADVDLNNLHNH